MDNLQVWKDRCDSLTSRLHILANSSELNGIPRQQTIVTLLNSLREFGLAHFHFFFNDFKKKAGAKLLDANNEFPKAAVLRWIIDQISYDMEVITRAWDQRRPNSIYEAALAQADDLSHIALQTAKDCGFISSDTTVLSYFQKTYSVRLIPYANVALVGVPITALTVPRDYLAIPHEVAHYVFRHGTMPTDGIFSPDNESVSHFVRNISEVKALVPEHQYLHSWIEELFADIYGCLVAGPVLALDFQDLQMDDPLQEFADSRIDHEDPVPLLRPDTYAKILSKSSNEEWRRLAPLLHKRWQLYRSKYWKDFFTNHKERFRYPPQHNDESFVVRTSAKVKADDIRQDSSDLISAPSSIFDNLIEVLWQKFSCIQEKGSNFSWSGNNGELSKILKNCSHEDFNADNMTALDEALDSLYTNFANELLNDTEKIEEAPESLGVADSEYAEEFTLWQKWKESFEKRNKWDNWEYNVTERQPILETQNENSRPEGVEASGEPKGEYGWARLAYADGWVTRGPEPNPTGD